MGWDTPRDQRRSGARFMLQSMPPKDLKAISDSLPINGLDDHAARAKALTEDTQGPGILLKSKAFSSARLARAMLAYRKACGDCSIVTADKEQKEEDASTADLQLQFEAIQLWQKYGVSVQILSQCMNFPTVYALVSGLLTRVKGCSMQPSLYFCSCEY